MKSLLFGEDQSWVVSSFINTRNEASSSETEKEMLKEHFAQVHIKTGRELFAGSWRLYSLVDRSIQQEQTQLLLKLQKRSVTTYISSCR